MLTNKTNEPNFGLSDWVSGFSKFLEPWIETGVKQKYYNWKDLVDNTIPHKYVAENGNVNLEVVVAGHNAENIKVKYSEKTHTLKVEDTVDTAEYETRSGSEQPWYYNTLNLEFTVPETIKQKSFTKRIENGVLIVTATYEEPSEKDAEIEIC